MSTVDRGQFKILVIDDTPEIRELVELRLEADGFTCRGAGGGPDGLVLARGWQPDLILLDVMMPDMNGFELCARLKADPATRRIPVIFLTARDQVVDRVQGLELGAVDFIVKPFDPRELRARIDVALRTKAAIDRLEQANLDLQESGSVDQLTGLFNRPFFDACLERELKTSHAQGVTAACFLLDLDHFKRVNDTFGHLTGDEVLRELAARLRQSIRRSDIAARFGGDEFAILMAGLGRVAARAAGEKVREAVAQRPFLARGQALALTTSIGVALFPLGEGEQPISVLERADQALYAAKRSRDRVVVDPSD